MRWHNTQHSEQNFMMNYIRAFIFSLGMILYTIFHATISLFTFPFPYRFRYWFITLWSRFIVWWAKIICGVRYEVKGAENIPKTPCVILSNHQSTWETLGFQVIFPPQTWVLKKELIRVPFFGWALALLEPISINRSDKRSSIKEIMKQGAEKLKKGRWVVIFPEGTRIAPGEKKRLSKGGATLAIEAGFPVLPVKHNAGVFWPRKGFFKKPGTITVEVAPMIDTKDKNAEDIMAFVEKWFYE